MKSRFLQAVSYGKYLVLAIPENKKPDDYFDPEFFPEEIMNRGKLTEEFLARYSGGERINLSEDFQFVVIKQNVEIPAWSADYTVIRIAVD